jgi:hypothetical protein
MCRRGRVPRVADRGIRPVPVGIGIRSQESWHDSLLRSEFGRFLAGLRYGVDESTESGVGGEVICGQLHFFGPCMGSLMDDTACEDEASSLATEAAEMKG